MAKSLNQVTIIGNLARDIELRNTPSGQNVTSFSLAVNRSFKDKSGEWQEATDWINCVAWGPLAERMEQYLQKGSKVCVQGRLATSAWEQDGKKRYKMEVMANDVIFLTPKQQSGGQQYEPTPAKLDDVIEDIGDEPINLDDIPF